MIINLYQLEIFTFSPPQKKCPSIYVPACVANKQKLMNVNESSAVLVNKANKIFLGGPFGQGL